MVHLEVRNESARKGLARRDVLLRIAERVLTAEKCGRQTLEVSVLFCDDAFIADLNRQYRKKNGPTDVLSFAQAEAKYHGARVLGDIVISLETVERNCAADRAAMRSEVRLLFCHGLLHLLGYEHGTPEAQAEMAAKQAAHLGIDMEDAWRNRPAVPASPAKKTTAKGASIRRGK